MAAQEAAGCKAEETPATLTETDLLCSEEKGEQNSYGSSVKLPQKRFFRQRAHANPFSDHLLE